MNKRLRQILTLGASALILLGIGNTASEYYAPTNTMADSQEEAFHKMELRKYGSQAAVNRHHAILRARTDRNWGKYLRLMCQKKSDKKWVIEQAKSFSYNPFEGPLDYYGNPKDPNYVCKWALRNLRYMHIHYTRADFIKDEKAMANYDTPYNDFNDPTEAKRILKIMKVTHEHNHTNRKSRKSVRRHRRRNSKSKRHSKQSTSRVRRKGIHHHSSKKMSAGEWYVRHADDIFINDENNTFEDGESDGSNSGNNAYAGKNYDGATISPREYKKSLYRYGWVLSNVDSLDTEPDPGNPGNKQDYTNANNIYNSGARYIRAHHNFHKHDYAVYHANSHSWNTQKIVDNSNYGDLAGY